MHEAQIKKVIARKLGLTLAMIEALHCAVTMFKGDLFIPYQKGICLSITSASLRERGLIDELWLVTEAGEKVVASYEDQVTKLNEQIHTQVPMQAS